MESVTSASTKGAEFQPIILDGSKVGELGPCVDKSECDRIKSLSNTGQKAKKSLIITGIVLSTCQHVAGLNVEKTDLNCINEI
ncbi:hypothetical protein GALMADRAFT_136166 [Galerina marginata CBS 339.88]|uniref:Uncharacterized protein n=1 Tax=Galerina marginata (strain CBS 339.88) TaxID=685588 RepID=A0A067TQ56_GALM3|nr:hypothetical protein GALMADRAFT_136166 [Galerina marginata CBS 339.88]